MKKKITLIFLFINFINYSQVNNGHVEYGIKLLSKCCDETPENEFDDDLLIFKNNQDKITLNLLFTKNESWFEPNISNIKDKYSLEDFSLHANISKRYESNLEGKTHFIYFSDESLGDYVLNSPQKVHWIITNETKMINGYLCIKATTIAYNSDTGGWNDNPKGETIAWFTPKIPFSFGPKGYNGLPGLILEIQDLNTILYVKNISLNLDKLPVFKSMKSYKLKTDKQISLAFDKELGPKYKEQKEKMMKKGKVMNLRIEKQFAEEERLKNLEKNN